MANFSERLKIIFTELDRQIAGLIEERRQTGSPVIPRAEIQILGQMSLLANPYVSSLISLADTGDLDALLRTEYVVEKALRDILKAHGLVYDETSNEIWLPPGSKFEELFSFTHVSVTRIDAESALVSKAVKAQAKNRLLIRQALFSKKFSGLADRIEQNGGQIEYFLEMGDSTQ
jgi:hypothetical protein